MRQLVIKYMACTDVYMVIASLIASKKSILCVEGVQHLVIIILVITFPNHLENLVVTRQSVWVIQITTCVLIHKLQG